MMILAIIAMAASGPTNVDGWSIERTGERCTATRRFSGTPDTEIILSSRLMSDFGNHLKIRIAGSPELAGRRFAIVTSAGRKIRIRYSSLSLAGVDGIEANGPLDMDQSTALATSDALTLAIDDTRPITFATGPVTRMMSALKLCGDTMMREWGIDPEMLVGLPPEKSVSLFSADDYPVDALRAGQQGRTIYAVSVLPSGVIGTCKIIATSGSLSLDARTCEIVLTRGAYPPGAAGSATRWAIGSIRWSLPQ